jgi:hypothetical protein
LQDIFKLSETKCYAQGTKIILCCFSLLSALARGNYLPLKGLKGGTSQLCPMELLVPFSVSVLR